MDADETTHLENLAQQRPSAARLTRPEPEQPAPRVLSLLASLGDDAPAVLLGRRGDVLAWNHAGHALIAGHLDFAATADPDARPSIPRMFFLDPDYRALHRNWHQLAEIHVGYLRLTAGRYPDDGRLAELIGELAMRSDEFATMWATGDVVDCTGGPMDLDFPSLGHVDVDYQVWLQPDRPDHRLEVYTPRDTHSEQALRRLARAAATGAGTSSGSGARGTVSVRTR